ncbi:MAG: OsmC family protein, partial [Ferruginibacter sp.]
PDIWAPEHLFLGSICSGFMTAYLGAAEKKEIAIGKLSCSAIGQINLYDNHLEFTTINLYPRIFIDDESNLEIANELLLSAYNHCIVANSVKSMLINHGEVLVEKLTTN